MIKRKIIFDIALTVGMVLVAIGITAIAVLRSRTFHRYVLSKIVDQASQATGARVAIGDFQLHLSSLRIDFDRIVLHGSEAASLSPLLQIDHVRVRLKIVSLRRHKIELNEIVIDRPSIRFSVDQYGRSNLPRPPRSTARGGGTNIFSLAIGHVVVNHGELDYNDRRIFLDGEVHDLLAQVSFDSAKTEYDGTLGYRDGRFQVGGFNPVQHGLQVRFGATPSGVTFPPLMFSAGGSTITVQARLRDYGNPLIDGSYQADVSTKELGKILKVTPFPAGQINGRGSLHYQNRANHTFLDNFSTAGQFHSQALALKMPQVHAKFRAVSGDYRLSGGTVEAHNVQCDVLGGKVSGELTLTHLAERPLAQFTAAVHGLSLEAVSAALDTKPLERAAISGIVQGTLKGSWEGSGRDLQLRADATIAASAPARQGVGTRPNAIPLQGDLHLAYAARNGVISLSNSQLTTSHTSVKLDGSTGKQSSLAIQAQSDDLREVDQIVLIARHAMEGSKPSSPKSIEPLGIGGSATFVGQ
ncbi:MAG TPA: hypothetical protein VEN79_03555, partial [Terriglobia bacterium]|nr:hypothetical protein [Terriglobia bacterium]